MTRKVYLRIYHPFVLKKTANQIFSSKFQFRNKYSNNCLQILQKKFFFLSYLLHVLFRTRNIKLSEASRLYDVIIIHIFVSHSETKSKKLQYREAALFSSKAKSTFFDFFFEWCDPEFDYWVLSEEKKIMKKKCWF